MSPRVSRNDDGYARLGVHGLPELDQRAEESFVDCLLRIEDRMGDGDALHLHLGAEWRGTPLSLEVVLPRELPGAFDGEMGVIEEHVQRDAIHFVRSGKRSDALLRTVSELYGTPRPDARMVERFTFTGIPLHQLGTDLGDRPMRIKLFGNDGEGADASAYFECYLNLDLARGWAHWNEKDPEYRRPLLQSLTAPARRGRSAS